MCSGLCKSSFFFFSIDLEKGKPEKSCTISLMNALGDEITLLGYAIFITGGVMFLMLLLQFPLWCHNSEAGKDEEEESLNVAIRGRSSMID